MDQLTVDGPGATYRWTLTGTNTGLGGAGRPVRVSGHEEWRFTQDGLIAESHGHFDEAIYQQQLQLPYAPDQPIKKARYATAHWLRFPEVMTPDQLLLSRHPKTL